MSRRHDNLDAAHAPIRTDGRRTDQDAGPARDEDVAASGLDPMDRAPAQLGNAAWHVSVTQGQGPGTAAATEWMLRASGVNAPGLLTSSNQAMLRVMRHASNRDPVGLDPTGIIESATGSPLPKAIRSRMERVFGHDFGGVRVHTDRFARAAAVVNSLDSWLEPARRLHPAAVDSHHHGSTGCSGNNFFFYSAERKFYFYYTW